MRPGGGVLTLVSMVDDQDFGSAGGGPTDYPALAEDDVVVTGGQPALLRLPVVYAVAVALRDAGVSAPDIARRIGAPEESMASLLLLADAKLASLQA
jgi:hypothetical protein